MKVPSYNKQNRKASGNFEPLPKGNYVCKILNAEEVTYKKGGHGIKISFDIAEGEYKDFYMKKWQEDTREDKKWNMDAVYYLGIPEDGCQAFVQDKWDTFWANVELSNNGYVFTGDEQSVKGKIFGGIFRIEQSTSNDGKTVYDHTKLYRTDIAQNIRDGKVKWVPKDKLASSAPASNSTAASNDFIPVSGPVDLPF